MSVKRKNVGRGELGPDRFLLDFVKGRYCFENFMAPPLSTVKGLVTDALTPLGTSLQDQIVNTGRHTFEYAFAGDVTDAFVPTLASEGGYNWAFGDAPGTGVEINFGGLLAGHPRNFTPITSGGGGENWFARILLITDDASGIDAFLGFRKVATYAATLTEYADVLGVRVLGASGSTDAAFSVVYGATDFTTASLNVTGLEDATAVELEVRAVNGKGLVFVNGVEYAWSSTKSFVADQVMAPVCRLLQMTDAAAQIKTLAYEAGPLEMRQSGSLLSLAGCTT